MTSTASTRTSLALIAAAILLAGSNADPGLQVHVDPETGAYSMPPPGTLTPPAPRTGSTAEDQPVITPGTSPAGGFKVTLPRPAEHE